MKTGLATLLQKNTMAAMDGIFSQVRGGGGEGEGVLGYRKGGGVGGRRGRREGLPYILKVFVCVYPEDVGHNKILSAFCVVRAPSAAMAQV